MNHPDYKSRYTVLVEDPSKNEDERETRVLLSNVKWRSWKIEANDYIVSKIFSFEYDLDNVPDVSPLLTSQGNVNLQIRRDDGEDSKTVLVLNNINILTVKAYTKPKNLDVTYMESWQ